MSPVASSVELLSEAEILPDFRIKLTIAKLNLPQEEEEQEMCQTNFLAVSQASL
jgi:hypothetical protein